MREGFDAPARQTCPRCGGMAKRVLFPPPIVFKGSGFYITDSRKGSQATVSDSTTPSATSPAETKGNGDTADSTPATSTPAATEASPAPASSTSTSSD
jgi:predicted nucleic acid-binding Zn ribbon protein